MRSSMPGPIFGLRARVLVATLTLVATGCAKQEFQNVRQPTQPVQGQVILDGKPVPNATIVFKPVEASKFKWREQPQAKSDQDGRFTVFTYAANDGAPAGDYRVGIAVVAAAEDEGSDQVRRDKSAVKSPARYGDAETSGLTAKVDTKPTELPAFELTSR